MKFDGCMELKQIFIQLCRAYCKDETIVNSYWNEIEKKYSGRKRHYHNLTHLKFLIQQLKECKHLVADWDTILFSVFYHDIIYDVLKSNNEERSAKLAEKRLLMADFPDDKTTLCREQILATKSHIYSNNNDTNLFTDADLSILGQPPDVYEEYYHQIRKEYSIFPDLIYNPGRKKVINHFLEMEKIFKTDHFFAKYEQQARINLKAEFSRL